MDQLQVREKEIFETLKRISKFAFVIIGGYAVNAYALPRFSVDCDIVVKDKEEADAISDELKKIGYAVQESKSEIPYYGNFIRYEKEIAKNFSVSIDILSKEILDRQTGSRFSAKWVFDNSSTKILKGRTISDQLKLNIIEVDALIAMKIVSCRETDIRDVFMMAPNSKNISWIKEEVSKRTDLNERLAKLKDKISSKKFKDNLQGVFGYVDKAAFEKSLSIIKKLAKSP
jgi:hypothetical protein